MTKQAVSRYKKGASIRQIADEFGRSYGNVHRMLREAGVELRGRGGSVRKKK
jgi:transposase